MHGRIEPGRVFLGMTALARRRARVVRARDIAAHLAVVRGAARRGSPGGAVCPRAVAASDRGDAERGEQGSFSDGTHRANAGKLAFFGYLAPVSMSPPPPYRDPNEPLEQRVEDLLARMTLAEKVGQLMQLNGQVEPVKNVREVQPGSLLHILNDELLEAMDAAAETRLGIPLLVAEDGIHGHSFQRGATIFPTQLALSCSWNVDLLEDVARVTAR